jgi:hypothetical protein
MASRRALDYFQRLVPKLGLDPEKYGTLMERHAFTMAAATSTTILERCQEIIANMMHMGLDLGNTSRDIDDILDQVGVTPASPQYSEMVVRTNAMEAFTSAAQQEIHTSPVLIDAFPVWRYDGIHDGREGDDHRPHFGRYYSNTVSFADVRGKRVFNCRCNPTWISKWQWEDLQKKGARVER